MRFGFSVVKLKVAMSLSWIYTKITFIRNLLYDRGVVETFDLGARTISIGNITTGGTGKTPLVTYIADILAARGEKVCILTRGYGRKNARARVLVSDGEQLLADVSDSGDEPLELAQRLLGKAIVVADADRVTAAEWAMRKFAITTFVLDDGFQHRKAKRDVDIVCIDATDPFGGGKTLPAGRLREPINNLTRADIVVITRANLVENISDLKSEITDICGDAAIFVAENGFVNTVALEEFPAVTQRTQSQKRLSGNGSPESPISSNEVRKRCALAFCGIGNPENFFAQLRADGFSVAATETFRDHHAYTKKNIDDLTKHARACGADIFLTTAKDAVKLSGLKFEISCFVVEMEMRIDDGQRLAAML